MTRARAPAALFSLLIVAGLIIFLMPWSGTTPKHSEILPVQTEKDKAAVVAPFEEVKLSLIHI